MNDSLYLLEVLFYQEVLVSHTDHCLYWQAIWGVICYTLY